MVSGCLAASIVFVTLMFRLWPLPSGDAPPDITYHVNGQELIQMEEIIQTQQQVKKPPPPAPLPPIVVPDDAYIEPDELVITDSFLDIDDPATDAEVEEGTADVSSPAPAQAETAAKAVRFVEPEYTREARRRKIRAEVIVEVLVDERGQVKDAKVVERYLLGKADEDREPVNSIGYGLEESALAAAERWMFRPARQGGKPVRSYAQLTFSFGI